MPNSEFVPEQNICPTSNSQSTITVNGVTVKPKDRHIYHGILDINSGLLYQAQNEEDTMRLKEALALQKQEFDYLDTLDLLPFIGAGERISSVIDNISDEYQEDYLKKFPNDKFLFNAITVVEFGKYIEKRYGIKFYESTTYVF